MKKKLLTLSAVLLLFVTLAFSASAVTIKEFKTNSTFVPVIYSSHKSTSSVTLYGNADYLCMKAYSETNKNEYFCIDIYSDSKRTKKILEYANTFKKGTTYQDIFFDLTSLKSKTYYATSYVIKQSQLIAYGNNYKQDPATVKNFKIVVKRDGTSIKNMKCFMYGYENTYYGPAIYWYSVPGATKYYVYKYVDKEYKKIATVKANGEDFNYYIDKSLKDKNTSATYKVKALNGTGSTALSLNKVKAVTLKTPTVTTELLTNGIKVSWSKPKSSCSYVLLRSVNGGDWEEIEETTNRNYCIDRSVTSGNTYYYTVVAYNGNSVSGYHPTGAKRFYLATPSLKSVTATEDGKLKVLWSTVKNAESYNVYRKAPGASGWTKVANVKAAEYVDADCQRNKLYTYTVRSVIGTNQSSYNKNGVSCGIIDAPVLNDIERTQDGYAKITWSGIEGASYKIYRKYGAGGWAHINTTTSTEYIDKSNLSNGMEYYYTVKACLGSVNGGYDKVGKSFIYLKKLEGLNLYGLVDSIALEWKKVDNAESYNVYRKTAETEYELIGSSQTPYYEDTTAQTDISYNYKVAYVLGGEEKSAYYGEIPAKLSSEYVSFADELAMVSAYGSSWNVKLTDMRSDVVYKIFRLTDNGFVQETVSKGKDYISFPIYSSNNVNEYYVSYVKRDGTVTRLSENSLVLQNLPNAKITVKTDHANFKIMLSWVGVADADEYKIYRNNVLVGSVTDTEFTDVGLNPDGKYVYKIITVKGRSARETTYDSEITFLKAPVVKVYNNEKGVRLSWDKCGPSYNVYRKTEGATKWTLLDNVSETDYTDTKVSNGKKYIYTVAAKNAKGEIGLYNKNGLKITYIKPTKITKTTVNSDSLQIEWKQSTVAEYYEVRRRVGNGKWTVVYKTKDNKTLKYKDKNVKSGTSYAYSVRAVKDETNSEIASTFKVFVAPPSKVTAKKVDNGIQVSFSKVSGVSYYYIYRKGTSDSAYKKLGRVKSTSTSYIDKTAKKGVKYSYYVKSYKSGYESCKSSTVSCKR